MALTVRRVEEEKRYRYEERLGILCGDGQPTPQQEAMARREAESWERARMLARMGPLPPPPYESCQEKP